MNDRTIRTLAKAGLLTAAIVLLTAVVAIPMPGGLGYINLGDAGVLAAAALLGGWWGAGCAAVGSALAGIGSVLYCCSYPQATPTMGSMLGLKAFVAAVLGGIGSIPGAMIGGIAIGLCECFVSAIGLSAWKDAVTFAILIIVLLVKPTGFLGRKVQEKV